MSESFVERSPAADIEEVLGYTEFVDAEDGPAPGLLIATDGLTAQLHTRIDTLEQQVAILLKEKQESDERNRLDPLTRLLNKEAFVTAGDSLFEESKQHDTFGLLFLDLRNFKAVNDHHPLHHEKGDDVLKDIASMLNQVVRQGDLLSRGSRYEDQDAARLGGDEFAILVNLNARENPNLTPEERVERIKNRLMEKYLEQYLAENPDLKEISLPDGKKVSFGFSIGTAIRRPGESTNMQQLLAAADADMIKQKKLQRSSSASYR